jgi:hypothetical protein
METLRLPLKESLILGRLTAEDFFCKKTPSFTQ